MLLKRNWVLGFFVAALLLAACGGTQGASGFQLPSTSGGTSSPAAGQDTPPALTPVGSMLSGRFEWIRQCTLNQDGTTPYALVNKKQDIVAMDNGWVLPDTGELFSLQANNPQRYLCTQRVIEQAKARQARVYLSLQVDSGYWSVADVEAYEQRVVDAAKQGDYSPLKSIIGLVRKEGYDGLIVDFEVLHTASLFTSYCNVLAKVMQGLGKPLGIALIHKFSGDGLEQVNGFQDWKALGAVAHFLIIMAMDEYQGKAGHNPLVTTRWLKSIWQYARSTLPVDKIAWELAGYCWLWYKDEYGMFKSRVVLDAQSCSYTNVFEARRSPSYQHENADGTLASYTAGNYPYELADPQVTAMFTFLRQQTGSCLVGSYYYLKEENKDLEVELDKTSNVFCGF
jgi:hypothetical protein